MEIIKLAPEDWKIYKDLRLEALEKEPTAFGDSFAEASKRTDEDWKGKVAKSTSHIFVAREGEDCFGMTAFFQESGEKMKHIAYIWGVYVRESHRGQKVSKKLMQVLMDEVQKNKEITKINLNVNTKQIAAVKLYESFGFQIAGTLHNELKVDGEYFDEHAMEKLL